MNEEQFKAAIEELESANPSFRTSAAITRVRRMTYYRGLKDYPDAVLTKVLEQAANDFPEFPSLHDLREMCDELVQKSEEQPYGSNFELAVHTCTPIPRTDALDQLRAFFPHEAAHIGCDCLGTCPMCGSLIDVTNPWTEYLMSIYTDQVQGWNPRHKGFMLCATCAAARK